MRVTGYRYSAVSSVLASEVALSACIVYWLCRHMWCTQQFSSNFVVLSVSTGACYSYEERDVYSSAGDTCTRDLKRIRTRYQVRTYVQQYEPQTAVVTASDPVLELVRSYLMSTRSLPLCSVLVQQAVVLFFFCNTW